MFGQSAGYLKKSFFRDRLRRATCDLAFELVAEPVHRFGDEVDLIAFDRPFLKEHREQQMPIGVADSMRAHVSEQNVALDHRELQLLIRTEEGVAVCEVVLKLPPRKQRGGEQRAEKSGPELHHDRN